MILRLLRRSILFSEPTFERLLKVLETPAAEAQRLALLLGLVAAAERAALAGGITPVVQAALATCMRQLPQVSAANKQAVKKLVASVERLQDESVVMRLYADDGWADAVRRFVEEATPESKRHWEALLSHCARIVPAPPAASWEVCVDDTGLRPDDNWEKVSRAMLELQLKRGPSDAWLSTAVQLIEAVGPTAFRETALAWLRLVPRSRPGMLARTSLNRELLRGLLWSVLEVADAVVAGAVRLAADFFYHKNSPLGNTCVTILSRMPPETAAAELSLLGDAVKHGTQKRLIEFALEAIAVPLGLTLEELHETRIPDSGFTDIGVRKQKLGEYAAEIRIAQARSVALEWFRPDGTAAKTIPARLKAGFAEKIRELKTAATDARGTLAMLVRRLEAACAMERRWPLKAWTENYLRHPIAGWLVRRLIWNVHHGSRATVCLCSDGELMSLQGDRIEAEGAAEVSLWHPIGHTADEVLAWRTRLAAPEITQPFKQAHREVYVLTAAELETRYYSNRFAAHILRQAQFRAVAKSRGWMPSHQGSWNGGDTGTTERIVPRWNLRAEFWTAAVSDEAARAYTYVGTDQVRFYRQGERDPMPLAEVPPLVFSELMRDIDLFVSVASVGNDPQWQDHGNEPQLRDYWHDFSFGDLSPTGVTRKEVLMQIIPRLKIASCCTFAGNFLVVRGDLRTYKIHLGSGNILMSPNDQYLCIVPRPQAPRLDKQTMYLPFEGDERLSVILSKAFLLAADRDITDSSIVSQISREETS